MARLNWDANGERFYGVGVDRGVLYPSVGPGVAWNGLISVKENTSSSIFVTHVDGAPIKTPGLTDSFAATLTAFTYPEEFEPYDGFDGVFTGQTRDSFGLCYREIVMEGENVTGYRIHLVYNASASPTPKSYTTQGEDIDIADFSWDLTTVPIDIPRAGRSAHLVIDSANAYSWTIDALEAVIYGSEDDEPRLPSPEEVLEIFDLNSILKITDHGDGTWTAEGPDEVVSMLDATTFQIDWPSVVYIDTDTYVVQSL